MKKLLLFTVFFFVAVFGYAQNLVPNAGFENYSTCPTNEDQADYANGWNKCSTDHGLAFGNTTPDFYNSCAPSNGFGVPQSGLQYQPDLRACGAYIGLITQNMPSFTNYREQVGVNLSQPLVIGQKYYLSFLTVMGGNKIGADYYDNPSNNIGMRLSTVVYNPSSPAPIDNFAHLRSVSIINDTLNWIRISGSIIADSAYTYLMLGNFYDDSNTDTIMYNCSTCLNYYSYYLVDNICVSTDSAYCNGGIDTSPCTVSVRELNNNDGISIFPNPTTDIVTISSNVFQGNIMQLTDMLGQVLSSEKIISKNAISFSLSAYPSGIYLLKLINQQEQMIYSKKIVKL
jgi:hypothetical protein